MLFISSFKYFFYKKSSNAQFCREAMLAEMGVAIGVDGHTVGLFQPKRVRNYYCNCYFYA